MNGFMVGIDRASELGTRGLMWAIDAGCYAALLAVVVLVVNVVFRRWLSAGQRGLLWGLVLVRLLVPVAPESAMSLQNLVWRNEAETAQPPDAMTPLGTAGEHDAAELPAGPYSDMAAGDATSFAEGLLETVLDLLPLLWLAAGASILAWTVFLQWRFSRRVSGTEVSRDARLTELWAAACREADVREAFPIIVFDGVAQPAVMGLVRPRLLLPTSALKLADEQLRMIMLHELAHVRRFDVGVNWMLVLVRAAQWWNPVYWLAASRFASLREQACDAFVIRRSTAPSSRDYSELLLLLAQRQPARGAWRVMLPVSILGFFSGYFQRRGVRNRLKALRTAGTKYGRWQRVAFSLAIALVALCGLTDAKTPIEPAEPTDWLPQATVERAAFQAMAEPDPGPDETRIFAIDKVLERIAADGGTLEYARLQIEPLVANLLRLKAITPSVSLSAPIENVAADAAVAEERPQDRYAFDGGRLTVRAPRGVQQEIARNLAAWEQAGLGQICVCCRFISGMPRGIAAELGLVWRYHRTFQQAFEEPELIADARDATPVVRASAVVNDFFPVALATLDAAQVKRLMAAAQGDRRANVLQGPKVTMFSGQRANIADYSQTPFVIGVREVKPGVQEPNVIVVDDGTKVSVRATHTPDRSTVRLAARVEISHIGEVLTAALISAANTGAEAGAVQLPRVKRCSIDVASEVRSGDSVLIGCMSSFEDKRFTYVLLTVQDVTEAAKSLK